MSRRGENIYKRKDGRWEARYVKGYSADGKIRYGYCYARSYREVKEKLFLKKASQLNNYPAASCGIRKRFAVCCDEWLILSRIAVKESTYVKYYSAVNKYIKPRLGGYFVSSLSTLTIDEFSSELLSEEGLAPKTVKDILVLLGTILKYTRKNYPGYLADIQIMYPKEHKKEMRVLTREEQQVFTDFLMNDMDNIKFGILLSLMTGLRIGEICALKWSDISLSEKTLCVRFTMQRIKDLDGAGRTKTKVVVNDPKSDYSARVIPLTDFAVSLCALFSASDPDAYVLSGSSDYFVEPRVLQYRLKQYTKECGLEGVHFHTLRHSFATRCVEVDFEIKSLSEILGHSSPRITLERYVHTSMELKRSNMDKLSKLGY